MFESINGPLLNPPIISISASAERFELQHDNDEEHPICLVIGALKVWLSVIDATVLGQSLMSMAEQVVDDQHMVAIEVTA